MKLAEINALRGMGRDELEAEARKVGVVPAYNVAAPTMDALRLWVIDAICDRELAEQNPPEDHDEPCDCGHGYQRHVAEETPGLTGPVAAACEAPGCDCQQYAADEAEAMR